MLYRIFILIACWPVVAGAAESSLTLEQTIDQALQDAPQVAASAALLDGAAAVAPSAGRLTG